MSRHSQSALWIGSLVIRQGNIMVNKGQWDLITWHHMTSCSLTDWTDWLFLRGWQHVPKIQVIENKNKTKTKVHTLTQPHLQHKLWNTGMAKLYTLDFGGFSERIILGMGLSHHYSLLFQSLLKEKGKRITDPLFWLAESFVLNISPHIYCILVGICWGGTVWGKRYVVTDKRTHRNV